MKIYSPNKDYTGVSASVPFCSGAGETEDPHLIEWFKDHGYKVVEELVQELYAEGELVETAKDNTKKNAKASV